MNTSFMTNVLLVIIAALLLVLVIQNGMQSSVPTQSFMSSNNRRPPSHSAPSSPTQRPNADMAARMFYQALSAFPKGCDGKTLLIECDSPEAKIVKKQISEYAQGKGPRQVFDYVIETWGEDALSDQAKQIRRQARGK